MPTTTTACSNTAAVSHTMLINSAHPGVSTGAVAGIGVGTFVFGLTVGLIAMVWICTTCWKRRESRLQDYSEPNNPSFSILDQILDQLPDPVTTEQLKDELEQIWIDVKNYVDNSFHDEDLPTGQTLDERVLETLSGDIGHGQSWARHLVEPQRRNVALRAFITKVLFKRIDPNEELSTTLLPFEVLTCYHRMLRSSMSITKTWCHTEGEIDIPLGSVPIRGTWRKMTAYLLSGSYPTKDLSRNDSRYERIQDTTRELVQILEPLAKHSSDEISGKNLGKIIKIVALFGWKLFSQSDDINFVWRTRKEESIVILPGLEKLVKGEREREDQVITISRPHVG